ncbi:MAG: CopD family protein [Pseudomonas sp.]|nr:CopD family protein [Pseudomonas sp.]
MIYSLLKLVHLLSVIIWIGGMVFTYFFLHPALSSLDKPQRVNLMHIALGRFFRAALVAASLTLVSGLWMIGRVAKQTVQSGGSFQMPLDWTVMAVLGVLMVAIFFHIRFALYKRLDRAVAAGDWDAGGTALASIRPWVGINILLGASIVCFTLLM